MPPPVIEIIRERHETPAAVERIITRVGGMTPPGYRLLARFRVIWGWNCLAWVGTGTPWRAPTREPKYFPPMHNPNRWYLEKWLPPEKYGAPENWNWRELGPYPSEGDYEHVMTLEDRSGNFIPLSVASIELMIQAVEFSRGFRMSERKAALERREAKKDREFERQGFDILDDAVPALHGRPFVTKP